MQWRRKYCSTMDFFSVLKHRTTSPDSSQRRSWPGEELRGQARKLSTSFWYFCTPPTLNSTWRRTGVFIRKSFAFRNHKKLDLFSAKFCELEKSQLDKKKSFKMKHWLICFQEGRWKEQSLWFFVITIWGFMYKHKFWNVYKISLKPKIDQTYKIKNISFLV